jgi:hypothetical protein
MKPASRSSRTSSPDTAELAGLDRAGDCSRVISKDDVLAHRDQRRGKDAGRRQVGGGRGIMGDIRLSEGNALGEKPRANGITVSAAILGVEGDGAPGGVDHDRSVLLHPMSAVTSPIDVLTSRGQNESHG